MSQFDSEFIARLNSLSPILFAAGFMLGDELDTIKEATMSGNLGITASAKDVDALCKGSRNFARRITADNGLTFGYGAGGVCDGQTLVVVAQGTVALSASATNYVELTYSGGTWSVTANTSGFTGGGLPLYIVTTSSVGFVDAGVVPMQAALRALRDNGLTGKMLSQAQRTRSIVLPLGDVSATKTINIPLPPFVGTLARASIVVTTTITANDTDYWTFGIANKGAAGAGTTVMVDASAAANSTKATGGSGATANVQRALTLSAVGGALDVSASGDVLVLTLTKAASAANLVNASVKLDFESLV